MKPWVMVTAALVAGCTTDCPQCREPRCPETAGSTAPSLEGGPPKPTPGMVLVPGGPFLRGSPSDVGLEDEHPQREIVLDTFEIDRTEVTVEAYGKCVAAGACAAPACSEDGDEPETRATHPVVCLVWEAADKYCRWAGKRLPTEAEWEKAARGTKGASFPWGEGEPTCNRANYFECGHDRKAVGSLPEGASPYGALDMAGNVYEWVSDWHHAEYYAISPAKNPEGPFTGSKKVVRGGAYSYDADELNAHGRTFDRPAKAYDQVGFRCAK